MLLEGQLDNSAYQVASYASMDVYERPRGPHGQARMHALPHWADCEHGTVVCMCPLHIHSKQLRAFLRVAVLLGIAPGYRLCFVCRAAPIFIRRDSCGHLDSSRLHVGVYAQATLLLQQLAA